MYVYACTYIHIVMDICMNARVYVYTRVHMRIYVYICIHMYIYKHTCTYVHVYKYLTCPLDPKPQTPNPKP